VVDSQIEPSLLADCDLLVKIVLGAINSAIDKLKSLVIPSPLLAAYRYTILNFFLGETVSHVF
jgi:hypothetical protein